ncbi:hypothetical protein [Rickettsia endosymbiont of Halotydeus destructor]|uniref:hypothetical protein n=1 Tax=Rickettsia endosymbiont of Halotydeus destructor TaxID=2996754 RepID=UPI003BB1F2A8
MAQSFISLTQLTNLTEEQKVQLQKLSTKAYNVTKAFGLNLKDLQKKLQDILRASLLELSKTEEINPETIEALFNNTIGKAQDALLETIENTYQEQLKTTDIFLFDGAVAEKILDVLQKILEFEKKLDEMYPGTSKKIIESLETLLIGVISTQSPLVGIFIKMSGVFDKINNVIDHKNLLPKIKEWRGQIQAIQTKLAEDKKLGPIYEKAEKTAEIAEEIEVAPHKVANLNLGKDSLEKVNSEVKNSTQNKDSLKKVIEVAATLPTSTKEVEEKISKMKTDLEEIIPANINSDKLLAVKKTISDTLTKTKEELLKVVNPQTSFAEKISACCNAAANVKEIGEKLKTTLETSPSGKTLVATVENTIKKSMEAILPKGISNFKDLAPAIKNIVGITQTILAVISKIQVPGQSRGKA